MHYHDVQLQLIERGICALHWFCTAAPVDLPLACLLQASAFKFWSVVSLFASATPLGIVIGYGFSRIGRGAVAAAMTALASGTFLYVAMMEVIPKELADPNHRVLKMVALLVGFGVMSLLAVWA